MGLLSERWLLLRVAPAFSSPGTSSATVSPAQRPSLTAGTGELETETLRAEAGVAALLTNPGERTTCPAPSQTLSRLPSPTAGSQDGPDSSRSPRG